ncbi:PREDICTED: uncharacterized protein LOC105588386 isoform X2 [Cercocebus atys]|uniref:uncharacterized protein LOC105588386 isoform X2 n=1 Tax=Cercocebus atys TaxID=9531 RepID=UPI0005F583E6|nr:PREDICTED: uncharacterized protein LOC105588386 isoform X2 [Cercocebus atys]
MLTRLLQQQVPAMRGQEHVKKSSYNIREKKRPKPDGGADPEEHVLHMSLQSKHNVPLELKSYCAGKIILSGEVQLTCCEDTQAALWKGPHGEQLRPPTNSQQETGAFANSQMTPSFHVGSCPMRRFTCEELRVASSQQPTRN